MRRVVLSNHFAFSYISNNLLLIVGIENQHATISTGILDSNFHQAFDNLRYGNQLGDGLIQL